MKNFVPILCAVLLLSFTTERPSKHKDFKQKFSKINADLYVGKYEVSNLDYRLFLDDLIKNNQLLFHKKSLPDSSVWTENRSSNEVMVRIYFRHQAYENYPVVGISYENALDYCIWLTNQYNQDEKRQYKKVVFQLLSKTDWMFAASAGDSVRTFPWGTGFIKNNRKQDLCNYRHGKMIYDSTSKKYIEIKDEDISETKEITFTSPVNAYFPNLLGLYNTSGNVAEMVAEKGIAKGGSYNDLPYQVMIKSEKNYAKPSADIGFRVSMRVLEK